MRLCGPHTYLSGDLDATDKTWIAKAPIVKAFDDASPLRLADPRAITIYRDYAEESGLLETILNKLAGFKPTYVEGRNEWKSATNELAEHIEWMNIYVPRCHAAGLKVAGFSVAVGNLDPAGVALLMAANWCGVDAVSYHAYWGMHGPFSDWTTYRYRRWYEQTGGKMPPVVITECGREAIWQEDADGKPGWLTQGISAEDYFAEWQVFDAALREDAKKNVTWQGREWPLVLGATGFALRGTPQWQGYELATLSHRFAAESEITAVAPPESTSEVPTMPEDPRIQQLLDQNAAITAALIALREGRFTGPGSVDGYIAALRGGKLPDGYKPIFPPKA